jgi:hypothetical protein
MKACCFKSVFLLHSLRYQTLVKFLRKKLKFPILLKEMGWIFTHLFESITGHYQRAITLTVRIVALCELSKIYIISKLLFYYQALRIVKLTILQTALVLYIFFSPYIYQFSIDNLQYFVFVFLVMWPQGCWSYFSCVQIYIFYLLYIF